MHSSITTLTLNPAIDRTVTIPGFTAGAVNRVERVSDRAGGKGINVAAMLAAHGFKVAAMGFLGRDNLVPFTALFAASGIEDRCLRLQGQTRVGIKVVDPVSHETTDINFPGLAPSAWDLTSLREQLAGLSGGWCVIAGSLPPAVGPGVYRELIALLKANGVRTVLDSSGEALREALFAAPDIVKPNTHELSAHLGRPMSTEREVIAGARELLAGGVKLVVVSRGADGACFVTTEEVIVARPPAVTVHSTVGAGDAMVAGVVAAQILDLSLGECARLSTSYALAVLTRTESGCDLGTASKAFLGQVEITACS
ncbi:MAG: hypothetical protein K0R17_1413 [Rariglobus sp.]|jgi:1-phosphofructokinase|nr:hypothetical protein [Rariglobus sp.]